ncbi:MAG: hypothetical protein RIR77_1260 [Planctomycetota bacterium]
MVRASGILRRIVVPVEKNLHPTDGPRPRGAKAVIDESTAARLSAVVGDGEFSEFAGVAHGAPEGPATTTAALIRRNTPAAAIAVATLVCLWVGNRMNQSLPDTVAHAGADGGSFGEPTAAAGPMFGAGRDPGARGGDPAMNLKNSARVAVLAVTAAVTANGALAGDAVQWRVADGGNGHWYQALKSATPMTWSAAQDRAVSVNGHLSTFELDGEFLAVVGPIAAEIDLWIQATWWRGPWIGAYQDHTATNFAEPAGGWRWITGASVAPSFFSDFGNGNPNNYPCCEDYLQIGETPLVAAVNDVPQSATAVALVVEWETDCNSDGIVDYGQCHDGTLPDYNGNNIPDCCEQRVQCTVGNYPVQWRVEDGGNGHWYRFVPNPVTWAIARAQVAAAGGYLVTVNSPPEGDFLRTLGVGTAWIGLLQNPASPTFSEPTGGWEWISGETLDYTNWRVNTNGQPNEPNNIDGTPMDVAVMDAPARTTWNDVPQAGTYSYWTEWSADCNNDNIVDYGQILNGQLADTNTDGTPDCCEPGNNCCVGDIYVNHIVDGGDLGVLLSEWGVVTPTTNSDLNRDGFVNGADLGMLLANWGPCGG